MEHFNNLFYRPLEEKIHNSKYLTNVYVNV